MPQITYIDPKKIFLIKDLLARDFKVNQDQYIPYQFSQRKYEMHKRFVDVQFLLTGFEDIYIANKENFNENQIFDDEKDIVFFESKPKEDLIVHLRPGIFVVIYPNEAHMPCIAPLFKQSSVTKCVAKIEVDLFLENPSLLIKYFS